MQLLTEASTDIMSILGDSLNLSNQLENLSLPHILLALASAAICGIVIYLIYRFFYRGIVYSDNFNILLVLITVVTSFIIMTVSSNLVLSLGMVGALSIVRFRSAIKDPLDVGFLFWGIAAGLTCGAGLYFIALVGTAFVAVVYILFTLLKKEKKNYLLIVRYGENSEDNISALLGTLKYRLKNKTQTGGDIELTIEIKVKNNDTTALSRFKAVEGVNSVTLLEYSGEYMN